MKYQILDSMLLNEGLRQQETHPYGLVAEEVAEVVPDLIAHSPDGTPI